MISMRRIPITASINKFVTGKHVAVLSMNNPPVNSLNPAFFADFSSALKEVKEDPTVSGLIIKSDLKSVFSAGLDLSYVMIKPGEKDANKRLREYFNSFQNIIRDLLNNPIPTAAIIGGAAPAGGTVLSLLCDIRIGRPARSFQMGFSETAVGLAVSFYEWTNI
jgi:enoyl-CoA hydratase/carnithine racemase